MAREIESAQLQTDAPVESFAIRPKKANVQVRLITLAWAPYYTESGRLNPAWE